jgi:hypothetical protein
VRRAPHTTPLVGVTATIVASLAIGTAVAQADIFAVSGAFDASTAPDLVHINLNTGARLTLPASINTSAPETHPSITPDGKRLVFERDSGSTRVIMVDLGTGQSSDLFNGFEAAARPPHGPAISPDGTTVFTGGPFRKDTSSGHEVDFADVTVTDVGAFPAGPYPHSSYTPRNAAAPPFLLADSVVSGDGGVDQIDADGSATGAGLAIDANFADKAAGVIFANLFGAARLETTANNLAHAALGSPGGSPVVVFNQGSTGSNAVIRLAFRPASIDSFVGTPILLPHEVNNSLEQKDAAFTPDGRYLAFIRRGAGSIDKVFLWDSDTQTIVNSDGVSIGQDQPVDLGSLTLYSRSLFTLSRISGSGLVTFNLAQSSGVGLLVQRVVGHHRLFGHRVRTLKRVGRVPLGRFAKRHPHRLRWHLRVNGKRLRRGTYQVTARALTRKGKVRDLGKPYLVRVRR